MPARHPVALRLTDREMTIVKHAIERLEFHNPHWQPTKSDAIRALILAGGSVPLPDPDPERPLRAA